MQFWHVTPHDNNTKMCLFKRRLLRGPSMLLTHQTFGTFEISRENLKNTFLCEMAQIYSMKPNSPQV